MEEMTIAGIRRGNRFSPNHIGNDAAIFSLTAEHLRNQVAKSTNTLNQTYYCMT